MRARSAREIQFALVNVPVEITASGFLLPLRRM